MAEEISSVADAILNERAIADRAARIRTDADALEMRPALFLALYPLLIEPIPPAYIKETGVVKGKPYESIGVRSVQVQIDRMNAVLTPMWWCDFAHYEDEGRLCEVTIQVGNLGQQPLAVRSSWGGVNQGSSKGNIYKGSYTNAAKRAFAALGPGHEVYVGAADLDPDVNPDVVGEGEEPAAIGTTIAKKMVDRAWEVPEAKAKLQLAATHAAKREIGDCSTKQKATTSLSGLTYAEAERLDNWIIGKESGE